MNDARTHCYHFATQRPSMGRYSELWHSGKGMKCPINRDFLGEHVTRTDAHKRISSAVHSTTLPPLQAP